MKGVDFRLTPRVLLTWRLVLLELEALVRGEYHHISLDFSNNNNEPTFFCVDCFFSHTDWFHLCKLWLQLCKLTHTFGRNLNIRTPSISASPTFSGPLKEIKSSSLNDFPLSTNVRKSSYEINRLRYPSTLQRPSVVLCIFPLWVTWSTMDSWRISCWIRSELTPCTFSPARNRTSGRSTQTGSVVLYWVVE